MKTQTVIPSPSSLPPAAVVLGPLLLTETSAVTRPASSEVAPEMLNLRATQVTVVLQEILEQRGYLHGGINE